MKAETQAPKPVAAAKGVCPICGESFSKEGQGGYKRKTCKKPACKAAYKKQLNATRYAAKAGKPATPAPSRVERSTKSITTTPPAHPDTGREQGAEIPAKLIESIRTKKRMEGLTTNDAIAQMCDLWETAGKHFPAVSTPDLAAAVDAEG